MVEKSWSVSFRMMYSLPRNTHRYFVEPISGLPHIKTTLIKNFLGFIEQIELTPKSVAKSLLETIKYDVRSTTGSNLRNIMQLMGKESIDDLCKNHTQELKFVPVPPEEEWRIGFLNELLMTKQNKAELANFSHEEINAFIYDISTT